MTKKLQLLVVDDHPSAEKANEGEIRNALHATGTAAEVSRLDEERIKNLIRSIERGRSSEDPQEMHKWFESLAELGTYDVIFLDYQLRDLAEHPWLTAEDLAGVIRAFGGVRQVTILNRFHEVDFDLRMTGWGVTSADLHLNDRFLSNSGLWVLPNPSDRATDPKRFRPWQWPLLPRVVSDIETCISEIEDLDLSETSVLGYLKMDTQPVTKVLTHTALGSLNPASKTPEETTFKEFLRNGCKGIDEEIRQFLANNLDDSDYRTAAARIITSELRRWLAFMVLGPQDVLIDSPHLAQRMPWLLDEKPVDKLKRWNATVGLAEPQGLKGGLVDKHRFVELENWFSRPVFWTRDLQSDDAIDAAFNEFDSEDESDWAFQEDFSRFVAADDCAEFTSAFNSIWANRFVSSAALDEGDIGYAPKVRLL